jgi:ssDNA-binding Zn-finger/Zn-ribbon topoisomerase 1
MIRPRKITLYKPSVSCYKCGSNYNPKNGINGIFFSCSKFPSCSGSTNAAEIEFTVFSSNNIEIKNNNRINCTIGDKKYVNKEILLHEGCFGIDTNDGFFILKECKQITLSCP